MSSTGLTAEGVLHAVDLCLKRRLSPLNDPLPEWVDRVVGGSPKFTDKVVAIDERDQAGTEPTWTSFQPESVGVRAALSAGVGIGTPEAVLVDGRHVLLLDDRGWTESGTPNIWATTSVEDIVDIARTVDGPDETTDSPSCRYSGVSGD
jgi:hypothetical protein